jgi:hypothetical protein
MIRFEVMTDIYAVGPSMQKVFRMLACESFNQCDKGL